MSYTNFDFPNTHFYDTDLRELIYKVTKILKTVDELDAWKSEHEKEYKELKGLYDDIISGNFPPEMYKTLHNWVVENSASIINDLVALVFFRLEIIDGGGYFVAYVPESWNDIIFGTSGLDDFPVDVDFGHLTLSLRIGG